MNPGGLSMFEKVMIRTGIAFWLILFTALSVVSCTGRTDVSGDEGEDYILPDRHADDANPLKVRFFQEPFRDLSGRMVQLENYKGTPLVIVVFPSFKTDDGRRSLVGMENLQREKENRFMTIFIPVENAETIGPSIVRDPGNMQFLFRADGSDNLSLADKYSDLFWNEELISADYPMESPSRHFVGPFYWIVDEDGIIREKLIDYSNERGVGIDEVSEVLDALLGSAPDVIPEAEFPGSVAGEEADVQTDAGEDSES